MINGKAKNTGLGALNAVSLAEAREKAANCRKLIASGIDPLMAKKAEKQKTKLEEARSMTFEQCATAYIETHKAGWKNAKHATQWTNTLTTYAFPVFGKLPVQDVDVTLVMKALEEIWKTRTETATRVRGRIESVLDWATSREYRTGENPARWRGKLENLLPARSKIQKVVHHPALPYADISDFMAELEKKEGLAALALMLTILTTTRTSEALNAKWNEFDLKKGIWIIPAERVKTGKEHRIPLSEPALKILKKLHEVKINDYVFSSNKEKPLSNTSMLMLLRRMPI
jgi:integrase